MSGQTPGRRFRLVRTLVDYAKKARAMFRLKRRPLLGTKRRLFGMPRKPFALRYNGAAQSTTRKVASGVTHSADQVRAQINRSASPNPVSRAGGMVRANRGIRSSGGTIRRMGGGTKTK